MFLRQKSLASFFAHATAPNIFLLSLGLCTYNVRAQGEVLLGWPALAAEFETTVSNVRFEGITGGRGSHFLSSAELAPIYTLLASGEASYSTGQVYGAIGGRRRP
jgi:hypothetical protein